ncbi:MAG: hypothetical protein NZ484_00305 [Patescibacteria group bacterium]|nr:hypothetical protein [Patescibacteria group bacterium]MCX7589676.1 hypothetical protein [Patescibacteria group bacterium]MDW8279804.1 hypothetical protein [bacterium]
MDIFAHALWTNLVHGYTIHKKEINISKFWSIFWGVFPDFFAFTPIFFWSIINRINLKPEDIEPINKDSLFIFNFTHNLYNISHSLIIFGIIFLIVYLIKKKIYFALFGWPLHILIDIPTHSYRFYPTPFLWPISDFKFGGISWGVPWFMFLNYSLILIFYLIAFLKFKNKQF